MQELADLIESGGYAELLDTIGRMNDKQRKAAVTGLVARWKEHVAARRFKHPRDGVEAQARWMRLLVALTAAAADPKKALAIPVRHGVFEYGVGWKPEEPLAPAGAQAMAALAQAAIGHGPEWCAQYLALIADAKKPRPMYVEVLVLIARAHALALPATRIPFDLWATRFFALMPHEHAPPPVGDAAAPYERSVPVLALDAVDGPWVVRGHELTVHDPADAVRAAPDTEAMLLGLFDHRDAVNGLAGRYGGAFAMDRATETVARFVADGSVDAARLARQAIAALSRGDSVSCQRLQVRLLMAARPAPVLVAEQARVLAGLLGSGTGVAASAALDLLCGADAVQPLPDDLFLDACRMVFARKEKGLRQVQLAWATQRAARAGAVTSALLGLAEALLCADHPVQKAAASAIEVAWPRLPESAHAAVRAQVEASRGVLDAGLYRALWAAVAGGPEMAVLDAAPDAAPAARPAPLRTGLVKRPFEPVPDPARLPAEVVLALGTYRLERDAYAHERAIRAMVDALNAGDLANARAIGARVPAEKPFWAMVGSGSSAGCELSHVAWRRLDELQTALAQGRPIPFVSTPSYTHGAIAPQHLVERLAGLARQGRTALPVDLLVALLRTETGDAAALGALRAVGSAQSAAAADFLAAGGAAQLRTRWCVVGGAGTPREYRGPGVASWCVPDRREVCVALAPVPQRPAIDGAPLEWAAGFEPENAPRVSEFDMAPDWITPMLPNHAEALAALHLYGFRRAGLEVDTDGGKNVALKLPLFLAAHGEAGAALHLAIFFGLSANDAPARIAGSDALVTLLQQGRYQAALACELLAACVACGSIKPGRLAASLAQVREAGESEAVWGLARAGVLAALGMSPVPPATAELVELAIRTASELGVRERIPALAAVAEGVHGKPNKLQAQVQRLHAALTAGGTE